MKRKRCALYKTPVFAEAMPQLPGKIVRFKEIVQAAFRGL